FRARHPATAPTAVASAPLGRIARTARLRRVRSLPVLSELPDDYLVERDARGVLAVRRDLAGALRTAGFGFDSDGAVRASDLHGRRALLELDVGGRRCVL